MRWRNCPFTGRLAHDFDRATHRCGCGRWERGFAPAKAPVRDRDECQVCERVQALRADGKRLGLHGYRRPGHGWIEGRCPGVDRRPFPETDALVDLLPAVVAFRKTAEREKARLEARPATLTVKRGYGQTARTEEIARDDGTLPWSEYNGALTNAIWHQQKDIESAAREIARITKRIAVGRARRAAAA